MTQGCYVKALPEFLDYRELFSESDIKRAVAVLIFHCALQGVQVSSSALVSQFALVSLVRLEVLLPFFLA